MRRSPEPPRRPPPQEDESSDSMDWGSSSSDSSSSSDDETPGVTNLRERFLKRPTEKEEDEEKADRRRARKAERRERAGKISKKDQADDGGEWETVRKGAATSDKPKMFAKVSFPLIVSNDSICILVRDLPILILIYYSSI